MRQLKEVYLSIFVLFYRISRWKGRMKASSASFSVSVVEIFLALTMWLWIQLVADRYIELNRWVAAIAVSILIVGSSDYFLYKRGHGIAFERQFLHFSRSKQIALYAAAISIVVVTGVAFFLTVSAYHQAFNLPRK